MTVKELQEKRGSLGKQLQDLLKEGPDNWDDEKRAKFDELDNERESIIADLAKAEADQKRAAKVKQIELEQESELSGMSASELRRKALEEQERVERGEATPQEKRMAALRDFIRTGKRSDGLTPSPKMASQLEQLGVDTSQNFIHLRMCPALAEFPLRQPSDVRGAYKEAERRAMGAGAAGLGQELVPDEMMRIVEEALIDTGNIRARSTVLRTTGAGPLPIPTSDDSSQIGEIIDENTPANEGDVATGQKTLNTYQYSSKIVRIHNRLLLDPAQDTTGMVLRALGSRIARIQNLHFTAGDGVGKPKGALTDAANSGVVAASQTALTYAEMIDIQHSLNPAYNANASWELNNLTIGAVKKIVGSNGQPIWMPSLVPDAPDTILGKPYAPNADMPAPGAAARAVMYGDLSKYNIRDMLDMFIVRLVERYAEYNQTAFLIWMFSDGVLVDAGTNPVVYATMAA